MAIVRVVTSPGLLLCVAVLASGCKTSSDDPPIDPLRDSQVTATLRTLQKTDSCDDVKEYLEQAWLANVTRGGYPLCVDCVAIGEPVLFDDMAEGAAAGGDAAAPEVNDTPGDVSQTNTQEPGVDEADLVETDSEGRIYAGINNTLCIVAAFPPQQLRVMGQLDLNTAISGIYLDESNQRIVVVGHRYPVYALGQPAGVAHSQAFTPPQRPPSVARAP